MHTGEIGFRVPKDRLPWSTLEGELQKQGYTILNWPQGVVREKDKGVYSLSAEEADKLYHALFVGERGLQFIPRDDGEHMSFFIVGLLSTQSEPVEGAGSLPDASRSDRAQESHRCCMRLVSKQQRFRVMTQEGYNPERAHKRRRM